MSLRQVPDVRSVYVRQNADFVHPGLQTFAKHGMLLPTLPAPLPVEWLKKLGIHDILGVVKVEEWDYIHTMIYADEVSSQNSSDLQ